MQELQEPLGSLAVTADDKLDPAHAIQQLRRIPTELDALGDKVMPTRKTHAFLKVLPDKHYGSFKIALLCEKPRDGSAALDFDDVAIEPPHTMPCRFVAKSPLMMMVQVVTAVRLTRSYTEGHASSAGKVDVCKDVVAEEIAAGPRMGRTARRTVTTCLLYTSPSPRDRQKSRMPSSA